jgi:ABC-2 type transport system permease protein
MARRRNVNFPLLKLTLKNNWFIWVIFTAIMLGYLVMIIMIYDPESMLAMETALAMIPEGLSAAVGMDKIPVDLTDFAANYFYGFLVQLFLLFHVIILPLRLVVSEVDNGSMAYLLSTKVSRTVVISTKAIYLAFSLLAMVMVMTLIATLISLVVFPGELDLPAFISLNFATFLVALTMASIVFFFSSIMDQTMHATIPGAGILILFFIFSLVARYGHSEGFYGVLANLSIFRFLQARAIISGEINMWINNSFLLLIIIGFLSAGIYRFSKRDLPL